jgi:hypothetical protein
VYLLTDRLGCLRNHARKCSSLARALYTFLSPKRHSFGDLPAPGEDISLVSLYFSGQVGFFSMKKKLFSTGGTSAVDRGERGMKMDKNFFFNFFHRTCGMCGELTAHPHVRRTCGPVRHPCIDPSSHTSVDTDQLTGRT